MGRSIHTSSHCLFKSSVSPFLLELPIGLKFIIFNSVSLTVPSLLNMGTFLDFLRFILRVVLRSCLKKKIV